MCWEPDPIVVPAQLRVPFPALALLARSALPCGAVGSFSFPLVALFASLGFQWVSCRAEVCLPRAVSFRMSPWHMDVLLEGLTCPSRRGSRSMGGIRVHGSAPELGSPLEQWDCAVSPQGHLGWAVVSPWILWLIEGFILGNGNRRCSWERVESQAASSLLPSLPFM